MLPSLASEIAALPRLRVSELRAKFAAVFGEPTPSHNKVWLVKRSGENPGNFFHGDARFSPARPNCRRREPQAKSLFLGDLQAGRVFAKLVPDLRQCQYRRLPLQG
jgi:hypothetical protein